LNEVRRDNSYKVVVSYLLLGVASQCISDVIVHQVLMNCAQPLNTRRVPDSRIYMPLQIPAVTGETLYVTLYVAMQTQGRGTKTISTRDVVLVIVPVDAPTVPSQKQLAASGGEHPRIPFW